MFSPFPAQTAPFAVFKPAVPRAAECRLVMIVPSSWQGVKSERRWLDCAKSSSGLLALAAMTDFSSRKGYVQIRGPRFNRCHGAVELNGDEREALPGFRHRAQSSRLLQTIVRVAYG